MKEIHELNLLEDLKYSEDHEWVKSQGDVARVGISDYAQDQLGDVIFVDLPKVGDSYQKGDEFGTIESVKAVSDLFIPIGGEIVSVNAALEDTPELVNTNPYDDGWMIDIKPDDPSEMDGLLTRAAYLEVLKGIEE
jgi:glycine cleavage system H protein